MKPSVEWSYVQPETIVVATLVVVFVVDLFLSNAKRHLLTAIASLGVLAAFVSLVVFASSHPHQQLFANSVYVIDPLSNVAKGVFLLSTLFVFLLGAPKNWKGEYIELILSSLLGMLLVVSARDFVLFFVAFELFAIPGYILTGWRKTSVYGHEGVLKYYLLGVVATAVMLYGLSLLFGIAGGTSYQVVAQALSSGGSNVALARLAVLFVVTGLAFKISAVPFHFWAPDAYQSAPIPVAAFLSVVTKAAGVFAAVIVCLTAFAPASNVWGPLVLTLSIATMTVGNVVALRQSDLLRLLAYSSIAQAGYLLIPLALAYGYGGTTVDTLQATVEYLVVYSISNLAAFGVVVEVARRRGETSLEALRGIFATSPFLALALTFSVISLAGVPPFGGWFAKLVVFKAAIDASSDQATALVIIAAINAAIGLVYYANVVQKCWLSSRDGSGAVAKPVSLPLVFALIALSVGVVATGVVPSLVTKVGVWATG